MNITEDQIPIADSPLTEPHFDEEATVLARPVVPLEEFAPSPQVNEVARKPRGGRGWIINRGWSLGLAFAGALLLGVSATAFYYSHLNRTNPKPLADSSTVSSGSSGEQVDVPEVKTEPRLRTPQNGVPSDNSPKVRSEIATTVSPVRSIEPVVTSPQIKNKPVARRVAVITFGHGSRGYEELQQDRQARREAIEQRREQRHNEGNKSSNQLLRIREIFEGPRKP